MSAAPVNLLAIETATETVGVAVARADGVRAELALTGRRRHVESLTPAIEHLLAQLSLAPDDLGAVAVDLGPGLFTGLRVGVAAAKGLAQALGIGVVGLHSLEILVEGASRAGATGRVLAAVDARRGEVFATLATVAPSGQVTACGPNQLLTPEALVAALAEGEGVPVLAVGDGAQRYAHALDAVPGVRCLRGALGWPPPAVLLDLAAARLAQGAAPVAAAAVVPLYMREADAKANFTQAVRA